MAFMSDLSDGIDAFLARFPADLEADDLVRALRLCGDDDLVASVAEGARVMHGVERIVAAAAGVVSERSAREHGHAGLAAERGHRNAVDLVQSIGGTTRAEAARAVRVGQSLIDATPGPQRDSAGERDAGAPAAEPWHAQLRGALLRGSLNAAQHDAIRRGLGEPPAPPSTADESEAAEHIAAGAEVWRRAGEELARLAAKLTVDELLRRARQMRETLDPAGAEERFARRFEGRSFRRWRDSEGVRHAHITYEDEMDAWTDAALDAALRPRRGGPRFVDSEAAAAASELEQDPRTLEQLTYDLVMDLLRAGAVATADDVFGARQPGVRVVVIKGEGTGKGAVGPRDPWGRLLVTGHLEDGGDAIAGSLLEKTLCENGYREVTVDDCGNPLDVGREQRLFTTRQKLALAVRDGGCVWPGCRVPASYCEAHHCDHWWEHKGRTDTGRGVLLCRFHHLLLHNNHWRITRDGDACFVLHPPPGSGGPVVLATKAPWSWAWDPPPLPEIPGWRIGPRAA